MATQRIYVGNMRLPKTGATAKWAFPVGYQPPVRAILNFINSKAKLHNESIALTCPDLPPPDSANPVWNSSYAPENPAGGYWETIVPFSALIPASGQAITGITGLNMPPYLSVVPNNALSVSVRGTIPAGITTTIYTLVGRQGNGRSAAKTFELPVGAGVVRLYGSYNKDTNILTWYVGENGPGLPTIQMDGPDGFSQLGINQMSAISQVILPAVVGSTDTYHFLFGYGGIISGTYYVTVRWLGQTKYGRWSLIENSTEAMRLTLQNEPFARDPDIPWSGEPPVVVRPAGAESCENYAKLTQPQFNELPTVTLYECTSGLPSGWAGNARAYESTNELLANLLAGTSGFDLFMKGSANLPVGSTLYGHNNPPDGDFSKWPVEAGYWGYEYNAPTGGNAGSVIVIQTNACGIITSRVPTTLYAD